MRVRVIAQFVACVDQRARYLRMPNDVRTTDKEGCTNSLFAEKANKLQGAWARSVIEGQRDGLSLPPPTTDRWPKQLGSMSYNTTPDNDCSQQHKHTNAYAHGQPTDAEHVVHKIQSITGSQIAQKIGQGDLHAQSENLHRLQGDRLASSLNVGDKCPVDAE